MVPALIIIPLYLISCDNSKLQYLPESPVGIVLLNQLSDPVYQVLNGPLVLNVHPKLSISDWSKYLTLMRFSLYSFGNISLQVYPISKLLIFLEF